MLKSEHKKEIEQFVWNTSNQPITVNKVRFQLQSLFQNLPSLSNATVKRSLTREHFWSYKKQTRRYEPSYSPVQVRRNFELALFLRKLDRNGVKLIYIDGFTVNKPTRFLRVVIKGQIYIRKQKLILNELHSWAVSEEILRIAWHSRNKRIVDREALSQRIVLWTDWFRRKQEETIRYYLGKRIGSQKRDFCSVLFKYEAKSHLHFTL